MIKNTQKELLFVAVLLILATTTISECSAYTLSGNYTLNGTTATETHVEECVPGRGCGMSYTVFFL